MKKKTIILMLIVVAIIASILCFSIRKKNKQAKAYEDNSYVIDITRFHCDDGKQYTSEAYAKANRELSETIKTVLSENGYLFDDLIMFAVPAESNCYNVVWIEKKSGVTLPYEVRNHALEWIMDKLHSLTLASKPSDVSRQSLQATTEDKADPATPRHPPTQQGYGGTRRRTGE